jgi:hypothetical protein
MKEFYQTYRANSGKFKADGDKKAKIVVTVCTIMSGDSKLSRGVSICSPNDVPNSILGRNWARRYSIHAVKGRPDILITDYRAIRTMLNTDCPFIFQSEAFSTPTFQEAAFFFGKKNVKGIMEIL